MLFFGSILEKRNLPPSLKRVESTPPFVSPSSVTLSHEKIKPELGSKVRIHIDTYKDRTTMGLLTALAVAAGATGSVCLAPVVLGAVGFTSAGIAAGSYAAGMMSTAAIANGGGVAAGSAVAVLQAAGMAGLSTAASAAVAGAGGTVGAILAVLI